MIPSILFCVERSTGEFGNEVGPTPATNASIYRNFGKDVGIGLPRLPRVLCCSLGTK